MRRTATQTATPTPRPGDEATCSDQRSCVPSSPDFARRRDLILDREWLWSLVRRHWQSGWFGFHHFTVQRIRLQEPDGAVFSTWRATDHLEGSRVPGRLKCCSMAVCRAAANNSNFALSIHRFAASKSSGPPAAGAKAPASNSRCAGSALSMRFSVSLVSAWRSE